MFRLIILILTLLPALLASQTPYFNIQFDYENRWEVAWDAIETDSFYIAVGAAGTPWVAVPDSSLVLKINKKDLTISLIKPGYFKSSRLLALDLEEKGNQNEFMLHGRFYKDSIIPQNEEMFFQRTSLDSLSYSDIHTFGFNGYADYTFKMIRTKDSGLAVCGYLYTPGQNDKMFILKCDSSLNQVFLKSYTKDDNRNHSLIGMAETPDGDLIAVGSRGLAYPHRVAVILRVNSLGNQVWWKDLWYGPNERRLFLQDVIRMENGDFLAVGSKIIEPPVGIEDGIFWAISFNESGDILWSKEYEQDENCNWLRVSKCSDGNYITCGFQLTLTPENVFRQYGVISKLTPEGNLLWHRKYSVSPKPKLYDDFWSVIPTSDGGYLCTGTTWGDSLTRQNMWFVKLDSLGCAAPGCNPGTAVTDLPVGENSPVKIYPNPTGGVFTVEAKDGQFIEALRIFDMQGRSLKESTVQKQVQVTVSLDGATPGLYVCSVLVNGVWVARQVVKK